jgi:tRNA-2-methylthio-N6-dimethylallyladenosine synthase
MKYFIRTFGCQMNFSDSERMATFFEKNNFQPTDKIDQADLVIFNTCGVRQMAEDRVYGQVHNVFKKNPEKIIIVTGCLVHRKDFRKRLENKADLFVSIKDFPKTLNLLKTNKKAKNIFFHSLENERKNKNNTPLEKTQKITSNDHYHKRVYSSEKNKDSSNEYLKIRPKYEREDSALVPIMTGCNNFCSYCIVPYARGREWSRPFKEIEKEISELNNQNKNTYGRRYERRYVTLLGQNVNSYLSSEALAKEDSHSKITFPILINKLAQKFPQITFNFLTSHPKDYSDELIEVIAKNPNISREIHLPIQSGSNKILKVMNRPYTQKHYLNLIKKTQEKIPEVKFSTDVIVGFPGETKKDFRETVKVFQKIPFFEAYINKYSPRPGTASFKLKDNVSWEEKKRREKELRKYLKN